MENKYDLPSPLVFKFGYVMLPLFVKAITPEINLQGNKFYAKEAFHVSIISAGKYASVLSQKERISSEEAEIKIVNLVGEYVKKTPLVFDGFLKDIRMAQEEDRKTILIMCKVKGIRGLFNYLRKSLGILIPTQPTHVTLYTLENRKPVGITSREELENLTKLLEGEDWDRVKELIN